MATVASNQYTNAIPPGHGLMGNVKASWGVYTYGAAASANDLFNACKLPKNSLLLWGWMATDDIDSGTETLEIDLGFTANGGGAATLATSDGTTWTNANSGSASATYLIDSGVLTGDAATDHHPAGMNFRRFQAMKTGPAFFSEETVIQAKITAAANAGGTGTVYVLCLYIQL